MGRPRTIGIEHLNIRVRDPEKSSRFYQKILGMKEAFSEPPRAVFLRCGNDLLTLARTRRRVRHAGMHFGFRARTKAEFDGWKDWLAQNRVKITSEREEESGGGIYFRDPDGYLIEVYYVK